MVQEVYITTTASAQRAIISAAAIIVVEGRNKLRFTTAENQDSDVSQHYC